MMTQLKAVLASALVRLIGVMPLGAARALGAALGRLSQTCNTRMARVTAENIAICFPESCAAQRAQLTRQSLEETGKLAFEICVVWSRGYTWLHQRILRVEGEDLVRQSLAEGKGTLILGPHLGNWEVLGCYLPDLGPVTSLYQPPKQSALESLMRQRRQQTGAQLVPTNRKGVMSVFNALKNGCVSGILPDQAPNEDSGSAFSPFFGEPALTMTLVHKLMQRTGCRAFFGYAKRVEGGFEIVFREPPPGLYSDDLATALAALNEGVENCVRELPAQYQWEYKRFKKVCPGGTQRYCNKS